MQTFEWFALFNFSTVLGVDIQEPIARSNSNFASVHRAETTQLVMKRPRDLFVVAEVDLMADCVKQISTNVRHHLVIMEALVPIL